MSLEVGSTLGDYQVIGILGAGGMGQVYKVRNTISNRVEAMKVVLPDLAQNPDLADRFQREIRVQASLEHPNIAALYTALRVENQLLMLMEFVEGVPLGEKLQGGPLPVALAVDYTRQVLEALEYAHSKGVVHRDIKPGNIIITPQGTVKLLDFGIARAATDQKLTMTGATVGSLYYMSPEQIQGSANLDGRSDLYSVGVSLYEMLTGKHAFDGSSQYSIMAAHLEKTPVPPIQLVSSIPEALSDAILISVAKDPEKRFQTAGAFRNALASCAVAPAPQPAAPAPMAQAAMQPQLPQTATMAPKPADFRLIEPTAPERPRSRRWLWMAAGSLAAALAIIAAIEFAPKKGARAEPQATAAPPQQQAPAATAATPPEQAPPPASAPAESTPGAPAAQTASSVAAPAAEKKPPAAGHAAAPPKQAASKAPAAPPPQAPSPAPVEAANEPARPAQAPPAAAQAAPAQPSAAARAQMQQRREDYMLLNARANGIRASLESLRRAQAAQGLNPNSRFTTPAELMDQYLGGAADAINAGDAAAAKDFIEKAERQVEILEKLLNR